MDISLLSAGETFSIAWHGCFQLSKRLVRRFPKERPPCTALAAAEAPVFSRPPSPGQSHLFRDIGIMILAINYDMVFILFTND